MSDQAPVLWQYSFSNYNEKVRWALDYKSIPHRRHSLFPGGPRSLMFSRNGTLPVLDLDGERIVDSTRIIEALEQRRPDPPLYPSDPDERSRALELEDFFDEHAGTTCDGSRSGTRGTRRAGSRTSWPRTSRPRGAWPSERCSPEFAS